jgi:serine O-acetyltransferase
VGRGSEIGGNVWLTHSVPAGSRVVAPARVEMRPGDRREGEPSVPVEGLGPELKKE